MIELPMAVAWLLLFWGSANGYPQSCTDVQNDGLEDGYYIIDPEQNGNQSFEIYCETSKTPPLAILHHNQEDTTHVSDYEEPGSYDAQMVYGDATWWQARSLVMTSESCVYDIEVECVNTFDGAHWWTSLYDDSHPLVDLGGTFCMTDNGERSCRCSIQDGVERTDTGVAGNWLLFPVTSLRFGDTGYPDEWVNYRVGPLLCRQVSSLSRYFQANVGKRQTNSIQDVLDIKHHGACSMACLQSTYCVGFNILHSSEAGFRCELAGDPTSPLTKDTESTYFSMML